MKKITLILLLFFTTISQAQEKLMTTKGIMNFEASVPFFEEVKATNKHVNCFIILKSSELNCSVIITEFEFKRDLMREHFNSNYMESYHYPRATFIGKIAKFDLKNLNEIAKEYQIKGKLKIHGKTKNIIVYAKIKKVNNSVEIISTFDLNTDDYNIKIPTIILGKISKTVNTHLECVLQ